MDLGAEGLDQAVVVRGNTALVEGILNNLLDNALRYGRGTPPRITVALHTEPGFGVLRLTDNGPGVDAALAQQLQQRWAQGDQGQRLGQGAGLGLAIVERVVRSHGGRLELHSAPGAGLRARLVLPLGGQA